MWPLVLVFSDQAVQGAPLAFLVICNICVRGVIGVVLAILIRETALLGEYERNIEFRRRTRRYNLTTSRIRHHGNLHLAQRNLEDLCLTNNFPFLSSRLLKIELKSTIASFSLRLVQNGFLYRL